MRDQINTTLSLLREKKPLVLCLTNFVSVDFVANSLLALGAAPLMSCDRSETDALVKISDAIYINTGTLNAESILHFHDAALLAKQYQKPLILDPVGAGASPLRTQSGRALSNSAHIIRGNASEIMALCDDRIKTLGVESVNTAAQAKNASVMLAKEKNSIVVVSGQEDIITDGDRMTSLFYGSPLMPYVTGMGCVLTAVIAAFAGVIPDRYEASLLATAYVGLCGNAAQSTSSQPGSFRTAFIDAMYQKEIRHAL